MSGLVTGAGAGVPIDCYDAIELLSQRTDDPAAVLLANTARVVADLWNDPPWSGVQRDEVEQVFPELAAALYGLLGGGPLHPPITAADVRPSEAGARG